MIADPGAIESLERSARAAMPARVEQAVPGWVIRVSGGTTKRVNSANPVGAGADLATVRTAAERAYRAAGLPVRFRLTPLAADDCDARLADAGYRVADPSFTMVAPLKPISVDPSFRVFDRADARWCDGLAAATGWSAAENVAHRALLDRLPPGSAVAVIDDGAGPVAFGGAGLGDGRLCLFDIAVMPGQQGRGIGRRLVSGLLGWAAAAGHGEALLQVLASNAPARALYASLGFVDAYPYHYRIAPAWAADDRRR